MTKTQNELQAELDAIEAKLSSGVKSTTVDGTRIDLDFDTLRRRASELRRLITEQSAKRPVVSSIYLGGF